MHMIPIVFARLVFLSTFVAPRVDAGARARPPLPSLATGARHHAHRQSSSPSDSLDDAQLATITTDTGAFAPGPSDYSRYTTLDLCVAAAGRARLAVERSLHNQLERDTVLDDTVSVAAAAPVARACGAHFTVAGTPVAQLPKLFTLAVLKRDAPFASAILAARITHAPAQRDALWAAAQVEYLGSAWRSAAEALLQTVDAQGPGAWRGQLLLHGECVSYYGFDLVRAGADTARLRAESERVIALATRATTPLTPETFALEVRAWRTLVTFAALWMPDSLPAVTARVQHALIRYTSVETAGQEVKSEATRLVALATTADRDAFVQAMTPEWLSEVQRALHQSPPPVAPHVTADYWFPAPGQPSSDTLRPMLGKITLICQGGEVNNNDPFNLGRQINLARLVRRWLGQYGAAGLDVTVVHPATGFMNTASNTVDRLTWYPTPAEEAQAWRRYVQDYEHLPVLVAVQTRQSEWLPAPDGRRLRMSDIPFWQLVYTKDPQGGVTKNSCAIIDRGGRVLYRGEAFDRFDVGATLYYLFRTPGGVRALARDSSAVQRTVQ